ncbi:MAG TPA: hypothetical protein VGO69_00710, partial [Pyrinomonadaceae bacterium]|nr:hypothetical protein [Pyrinomonadaceae bacterium]
MALQQSKDQKKPNTAEAKTADTSVPNAARNPPGDAPNKKTEATRSEVLPAGIAGTESMNAVERMIPADEPPAL